jgi:hypothetical protein
VNEEALAQRGGGLLHQKTNKLNNYVYKSPIGCTWKFVSGIRNCECCSASAAFVVIQNLKRDISPYEGKFYVVIAYIYMVEMRYQHNTWKTFIAMIIVALGLKVAFISV